MRALNTWLTGAKPADTVLFFFSGHGATDDKGRNYLVPVDAQVDLLEDTAIRMERLNEILDDRERIAAKKVIVVLDSCHSGAKVGQKAFTVEGKILDPLFTDAEGRITFASCNRNESSYEEEELGHGVFSYYMAEGLRGAGDRDEDGYIDADELFTYVADSVRTWGRRHGYKQTPRKQSNVMGSILIGYHPENLAQRQHESAQEKFDAYRRKLRSILELDAAEVAQAERLLEREVEGEPLTKVEQEWFQLIRDLADGKIGVKVYLLAKRGLGVKPELPTTEVQPQTETEKPEPETPSKPNLPQGDQAENNLDLCDLPQTIVGKDGAPMVLIPAGEFQMGGGDNPVHTVYLDTFYIDKYEVTNAQFKSFIDANPRWKKHNVPFKYREKACYLKHWNDNTYPDGKGNHPVVYVTWYAAMAYSNTDS